MSQNGHILPPRNCHRARIDEKHQRHAYAAANGMHYQLPMIS